MTSHTAADIQPRLDDLLEHLPAGVVVHGPDGRIPSANRLACELIGKSVEQLKGTESTAAAWRFLCADGSPMPPEQFPVNVVLRTSRKLSQVILGVPGEEPESGLWVICNAYPEFDASGVLCRVVVCFTDGTATSCEVILRKKRSKSVNKAVLLRMPQHHPFKNKSLATSRSNYAKLPLVRFLCFCGNGT